MLAEQASTYSAAAAEHASHLGKAAAVYSEGARTQLAGIQLPDALSNLQVLLECHATRLSVELIY